MAHGDTIISKYKDSVIQDSTRQRDLLDTKNKETIEKSKL